MTYGFVDPFHAFEAYGQSPKLVFLSYDPRMVRLLVRRQLLPLVLCALPKAKEVY